MPKHYNGTKSNNDNHSPNPSRHMSAKPRNLKVALLGLKNPWSAGSSSDLLSVLSLSMMPPSICPDALSLHALGRNKPFFSLSLALPLSVTRCLFVPILWHLSPRTAVSSLSDEARRWSAACHLRRTRARLSINNKVRDARTYDTRTLRLHTVLKSTSFLLLPRANESGVRQSGEREREWWRLRDPPPIRGNWYHTLSAEVPRMLWGLSRFTRIY